VPNGTLPDPLCTPGAVDPHVTQATIGATICRRGGHTSTVRPPASVTGTEKKSALRAYNDTAPSSGYEPDHLVPLELGGSPNNPRNLWPEPGAAPNPKDKLETALHDLACSHRMTLTDAQTTIATDWVAPTARCSAPHHRPARTGGVPPGVSLPGWGLAAEPPAEDAGPWGTPTGDSTRCFSSWRGCPPHTVNYG
jgi:hypothetical protein